MKSKSKTKVKGKYRYITKWEMELNNGWCRED